MDNIKNKFSAFIKTVLVNERADYIRKLNNNDNRCIINFSSVENSLNNELIHIDEYDFIDTAYLEKLFSKLNIGDSKILKLRLIENYNEKETADILGMKVEAVRKKLYRAKQKLKILLEAEKSDEQF